MSQPVLELAGATVVKSDRRVLDNLNLTIPAGQHTAIVGPNGAGKSLLVKLLTHEVRALVRDDGQSAVRVFGSDNWDVFDPAIAARHRSADLHQRFVGNSEAASRRSRGALRASSPPTASSTARSPAR
jgi:iron complex transport system ATP-binding protein